MQYFSKLSNLFRHGKRDRYALFLNEHSPALHLLVNRSAKSDYDVISRSNTFQYLVTLNLSLKFICESIHVSRNGFRSANLAIAQSIAVPVRHEC